MKKTKLHINKKHIYIVVVFLLFAIVFFLGYLLFQKIVMKKELTPELNFAAQNEEVVFEINNIVLFSGSDAEHKSNSISTFTIQNLYQFTDIALFVSSPTEEKDLHNTLKSVKIDNIEYTKQPEYGQPQLYFKGFHHFSKGNLAESTKIEQSFDFDVTAEDEANIDTPVLYNNLANPITLSYINQNIRPDYTITDITTPITYDGSLLKKCNVALNAIQSSLSFDILITNNLDQQFKCRVFIDIPLSSEEISIYDGSYIKKQDTNYTFYRYQ